MRVLHRNAVALAAVVLVAGLLAVPLLAAPGFLSTGSTRLAPSSSPAARSYEGSVLVATQEAGPGLARCAEGLGLHGDVAALLPAVTPGLPFALRATGANAVAQDIEVHFLKRFTSCGQAEELATFGAGGANGDEAFLVPDDATVAVVWLYTGGAATFRYAEFAPLPPAGPAPEVTGTMTFGVVQPREARSIFNDMYEPHIVVAATGAMYVTGHTPVFNTLHAPLYVSTDGGLTWRVPPDPAPLPTATTGLPVVGGRVGQGNEGGIAADGTGRAWLYDAAWFAGTSPLYGWCDDGSRSCSFDPMALDHAQLLTQPCGDLATRFPDKPWARFGHGTLLLANAALPNLFVDEFRAASMLGTVDAAGKRWNTCVGVGGVPGVPSIREGDGMIAVPQVVRSPAGEGAMVVHLGLSVDAMKDTPIAPAQMSWQTCQSFNGYSTFDAAGNLFVLFAQGPKRIALAGSADLRSFGTRTFEPGGVLRYLWAEGSPRGPGALVSWAMADDCGLFTPQTFYAAHVDLVDGQPVLSDVSVVAGNVRGTCGHYMGNDVGPDGRAYLIIEASPYACESSPDHLPLTDAPWNVYVQSSGPTL